MLQQRDLIHEFIAGGAVYAPVVMQMLATGEDLLDIDRHMILGRFGRARGVETIDPTSQLAAVTARVGQAIDMVDS